MSAQINPGDRCVISRDIILGDQRVAFRQNDPAIVDRIEPSELSPQNKYIVFSPSLNQHFALSEADLRSAQTGVPPVTPPPVAPAPSIQAGQQVVVTRDIIVENQYAFRENEAVIVERVQPLVESPSHKFVVTSRTLNRQFTLSDADVRGGLSQPRQTSEVGVAVGSAVGSAISTIRESRLKSDLRSFWESLGDYKKWVVIGAAVLILIFIVVGIVSLGGHSGGGGSTETITSPQENQQSALTQELVQEFQQKYDYYLSEFDNAVRIGAMSQQAVEQESLSDANMYMTATNPYWPGSEAQKECLNGGQ